MFVLDDGWFGKRNSDLAGLGDWVENRKKLPGGIKYIANKVKYILKTVQLENKNKSYPYELSGGEQQRVALARAIINNPHTVIADEPTGNLDPKLSMEIMGLLVQMCEYGKTVVVVTHEEELAKMFKQRIVRLKDGHLVGDEAFGGDAQ